MLDRNSSRRVLREAHSNARTVLAATPDDPAYVLSADELALRVLQIVEYLDQLDHCSPGKTGTPH